MEYKYNYYLIFDNEIIYSSSNIYNTLKKRENLKKNGICCYLKTEKIKKLPSLKDCMINGIS